MEKHIWLSQGKSAIVDEDDYDFLMQWKWYLSNRGYATRDVVHKWRNPRIVQKIAMHKVIMKSDDRQWIDHINRNSLDNRKSNLRFCTQAQNVMNVGIYKNKKSSKFKGVFRRGEGGTYRAIIGFKRKIINLGTFENEIDAAKAYNDAAKKYFGEFANLNTY